jgi:hypothetical protein
MRARQQPERRVADKTEVPEWMRCLVEQVSAWPGVSTREHRFGGVEFRLGAREIGHVHDFGTVEIPFIAKIRNVLLRSGMAERHRWLAESGWTTIRIEGGGIDNAVRLLRLSYLRIQMKSQDRAAASDAFLELQESGFRLSGGEHEMPE